MSLLRFFGLSPAPSDDFWYSAIGSGSKTAAGVAVDENVALTYSACWAATMLLSTTGSMVPLKLFRRLPEGGSEPASDLRRYYLVHDQFNPDMTNFMFRSSRFCQQINCGNAYGEFEFDRAGKVVAIHPIHASRIPPHNIRRDADGTLFYLVNNDDGTKTRLEAWEVFHVPSPISDDGICGKGVVTQARLSIGFGIATETQGAAYMGNSARPKIVIKGGRFKDKADRDDYRRQWEEVHGGPENNARPAMLPQDADITALQWSAEDSQFLQTRQHNIEEVARWYGVPPHMIQHLLRSTYNNIEHQSLEFVKYSLMRWLVPWEEELNRKLLSTEERKTLFFRHVVDGLERGDLQTRTAALKEQFFNGKLTLNEWRALDDQNPIGPVGDIHFVQQAMIPVEIAAKGPQEAAGQQKRDLVEAIQKIYLGVGRVITADEARRILNDNHSAGLPLPGPTELGPANPTPQNEDDAEADGDGDGAERQEDMAAKTAVESIAAVATRLEALEARRHDELKAATLEVVEDVLRVMLDREAKSAIEASRKPSGFVKWMDAFYEEHAVRLEKALASPIRAAAIVLGQPDSAPLLKEAVARHVAAGRESLLAAASVELEHFPQSVERCVSTWQRQEILTYLGGINGQT